MITVFTGKKEQGKIGELLLDVTLRENHSYKNDVTDYPVEDGFDINDHIRALPERLTMEGFITNTPISSINILSGEFTNLLREDNSNRDILAFNTLLEYGGFAIPKQPGDKVTKINKATLLDIVSTLKLYTNMIITDMSVTVDATTDNSLKFVAEFKKLSIVDSDITVIDNSSELNGKALNIKNQAPAKINTGVNSTTVVDEGTVLYNIGVGVKGALGK